MWKLGFVYQKEMRSYFGSPIAYVVAACFLALSGYFFHNYALEFNDYCRAYSFEHQRMGMPAPNVDVWVIKKFYTMQFFIWLLVTPLLTMRLYAEEKRGGTMELLVTSPLTVWQTLFGKFLACLTLFVLIEALVFVLVLFLSKYGSIGWGPVWTGSLGVLLIGATFISVGILASSLTDNQIVAAVVSLILLLLLWLLDWSSRFTGQTLADLMRYISIEEHMRDLVEGVVDTKDVVFYLSATFFFLFMTYTSLESRRWRE